MMLGSKSPSTPASLCLLFILPFLKPRSFLRGYSLKNRYFVSFCEAVFFCYRQDSGHDYKSDQSGDQEQLFRGTDGDQQRGEELSRKHSHRTETDIQPFVFWRAFIYNQIVVKRRREAKADSHKACRGPEQHGFSKKEIQQKSDSIAAKGDA